MKKYLGLLAGAMLLLAPSVSAQVGMFDNSASIGDDGGIGLAEETDGVYRMEASGNDVWGTADGFYFIWNEVEGNFRMTVDVEWLDMVVPEGGPETGNTWKKAGIMARNLDDDVTNPGARHVNSFLRTDYNSYFQQREVAGEASTGIGEITSTDNFTNIVRLERFGDTFVASRQNNDGSFVTMGSITKDDWGDTVALGLFMTAHDVNQIAAVQFSNVAFQEVGVGAIGNRQIDAALAGAGETVADVIVDVTVQEGETASLTVTETLPSGWSASSVEAGAGSASVDGNVITWELPDQSGHAQLTYDMEVAAGADFGPGSIAGSIAVGDESFGIGGSPGVYVLPSEDNGLGIFDASTDVANEFSDADELGTPGDARFDPNTGTYYVAGSGNDVWNNADNFHFLYTELSGDFTLSADLQLDPFQSGDGWVKGMLMARETLESESIYFSTRQRPDGQFSSQWRDVFGAASSSSPGEVRVNEGWTVFDNETGSYRLERVGDTYTTYYQDPDSGEYVEIDGLTLPMLEPLHVGLGVTAHDVGPLSIGMFSSVTLETEDGVVGVDDWALF